MGKALPCPEYGYSRAFVGHAGYAFGPGSELCDLLSEISQTLFVCGVQCTFEAEGVLQYLAVFEG